MENRPNIGDRNGHSLHSVSQHLYLNLMFWQRGGWFKITMASHQYKKSHRGDKTILRPSYLHNGIAFTSKMTSLYWIRTQYYSAHTMVVDPFPFIPLAMVWYSQERLLYLRRIFSSSKKVYWRYTSCSTYTVQCFVINVQVVSLLYLYVWHYNITVR